MLTTIAVAALTSFTIAVASGEAWIRIARRTGLVDAGDGVLKEQREPVPYLGGAVVLVATTLGVIAAEPVHPSLLLILGVAGLAGVLGLVDDAVRLRAATKLGCQVVLAMMLVLGDASIRLSWFESAVDVPLTMLWVVALTNALNFIDVSDGLCAAVSVSLAAVLCLRAASTGAIEAPLCAGLGAAALGFLRFNWRPARMYLGDSGSMLLGFVFAPLTLRLEWTQHHALSGVIAPLAVMSTPLFELCFVISCRLLLRLPVHAGSPDHAAVRLRAHGVSPPAIAMFASAAAALGGACAILATWATPATALGIGAGGIVVCLVAGWWLWRLDPRVRYDGAGPAAVTPELAD